MKALALTEMQQWDLAVEANEDALELTPAHSETLNNLGVALSKDPSTLERALRAFQACVMVNPLHANAQLNIGRLLRAFKRDEEAAEQEALAQRVIARLHEEGLGARGRGKPGS
jgi:tetratricopeptide (TPR) repeat protein